MDDFTSTKPPGVLDYGRSKPMGYRATQKLTRFFPISSLPSSDIVRFIINSQGFWDPYSSYLRITVNMKTPDAVGTDYGASAAGACQLDNSAASLIQTLSFIQNGVEIERIDRYEVLASMLNDMFFSREQRQQRAHQGFGCGLPEIMSYGDATGTTIFSTINANTSVALSTSSTSTVDGNCLTGAPRIRANLVATGPAALSCNSTIEIAAPYMDGCNEPILSAARSTAYSYTNSTMTFCIPILSGIFGVLMPADEIKYIPMQFFPNLEMNFRLNPYAMHNLSNTGATRNFQVTACELFVNIIHFPEEINRALAEMIRNQGLYMHTCSYYYGPSHMIQAGGSFETYPINMSFKSLRSIFWCFIPSAYRTYPYLRELRRKALNLQSAQCRIGGDLFPTFPIGNLGASSDSGNPYVNSDFVTNTYKAFGRLHDTVNDSLVNTWTFACGNNLTTAMYNRTDASFSSTFWVSKYIRGYELNSLAARTDLRLDQRAGDNESATYTSPGDILLNTSNCNWFVNQIVPRAVYGIDLDTITSDDSVISGVNTLINKPFELLLDGRNNSGESCELNMFLYYDMVVMIDRDFTVKYLGRGG
jgi:hypothetical protein